MKTTEESDQPQVCRKLIKMSDKYIELTFAFLFCKYNILMFWEFHAYSGFGSYLPTPFFPITCPDTLLIPSQLYVLFSCIL